MGSSTNRPKIAGRKLEWDGGTREAILKDAVSWQTLYVVKKLYDSRGKPIRDEIGRFQYQAYSCSEQIPIGPVGPYLGCAKKEAEDDFAERHNGEREGYWSKRS